MSEEKSGRTVIYDKGLNAQVIEHDDGSFTTRSRGATLTTDADGKTKLNVEKLRFIGIRNVPDLLEYTITREGDVIRHMFKLVNGGEGRLEYGTDSKIRSFSVTGAGVQVTPEGDILIACEWEK